MGARRPHVPWPCSTGSTTFVQLKRLSITEGVEVGVMSSARVGGGGAQRSPQREPELWVLGEWWVMGLVAPGSSVLSGERLGVGGVGSAGRKGVLLRPGQRRDPRQSSGLQAAQASGALVLWTERRGPFPDLKLGSQLKRKQDGVSGLSSSFAVLI